MLSQRLYKTSAGIPVGIPADGWYPCSVDLTWASNGGVGVISTYAALSFTPSLRKTQHPEGTVSLLRSIGIAALLLIRLSRPGLAGTLLLSDDAWVPAK